MYLTNLYTLYIFFYCLSFHLNKSLLLIFFIFVFCFCFISVSLLFCFSRRRLPPSFFRSLCSPFFSAVLCPAPSYFFCRSSRLLLALGVARDLFSVSCDPLTPIYVSSTNFNNSSTTFFSN